jgi:hypothetical protein
VGVVFGQEHLGARPISLVGGVVGAVVGGDDDTTRPVRLLVQCFDGVPDALLLIVGGNDDDEPAAGHGAADGLLHRLLGSAFAEAQPGQRCR